MTDDQIRLRGWSVPIYRAVQLAGGPAAVADAMGFKAKTTPMYWYKSGSIMRPYIGALCSLGGNRITPLEIQMDVEQRRAESRAAA